MKESGFFDVYNSAFPHCVYSHQQHFVFTVLNDFNT